MSPDLEQRIISMRYQPTTVGNMMVDPEGSYASAEAIEILQRQLAAKDALIAELQKAVNLIYSWARNWDSEFMNDPEWKDSDFPSIQLIMKQSGKEQGK